MFDDCKGEKLLELLTAFSKLVLRKTICQAEEGKESIGRKLCIAEQLPQWEKKSLLPLAVAHRASLQGMLKKKRELRVRYREFGNILDMKSKELNHRFEKVVGTQAFLDQNIASEGTVSRVAKHFEQHWKGDHQYINVVAQGEESTMTDAMLDVPFQKSWSTVEDGTFAGDITTSHTGLLEELERRVATQNERLQRWRDLKTDLQMKAKPASPVKQGKMTASPSKASYFNHRKEKDLVFSPRKSPRKSDFPLRDTIDPSSSPLPAVSGKKTSLPMPETKEAAVNDNSGFSEISSHDVTMQLNANTRESQDDPEKLSRFLSTHASSPISDEANDIAMSDHPIDPFPPISQTNGETNSTPPNEEDDLAEKIISQTLNAPPTPPTPLKPPLSLLERTRQSMALASPGAKLSSDPFTHHPPPAPHAISEHPHAPPSEPQGSTLLARTRTSISLAASKPKAPPRASVNDRRTSKIYPVNQFETPRKMDMLTEVTPPEELFSPSAGYDSVFKSRPKIAMSPTPGSSELDENDGILDAGSQGQGLEESPLARLTTRA